MPKAISHMPFPDWFVGQTGILCYETIRIESFLSRRSSYGIVQKSLSVFTCGRFACIPAGKMKAIVLKEFGGPEVLHLEDVPTAAAGEGEILLKVHSVSVNRTLDLVVRQGEYPVKVQLPHVLGVDPAGIVAEVGAGVDNFKPGDRVAVVSFIACRKCRYCEKSDEANCLNSRHLGLHRWGGYAEYVAAPGTLPVRLS